MLPKKNTLSIRPLYTLAIGIALGFIIALLYTDKLFHLLETPAVVYNKTIENSNQHNIRTCFTPPAGCGQLIVNAIDRARETILVQAYQLTSEQIVEALIRAHDRGVRVSILIDKTGVTAKYSKVKMLKSKEVSVAVDKVTSIAHNKVMIIDGLVVITGSFNFTDSADNRNAENVVFITDKDIANEYTKNWHNRSISNAR